MTNVVSLRRSPEPPCDTEPSEPAELGLKVPTLRAEDCTWLGRLIGRWRRAPEPTTFGKCLAIHCHHTKHTGALR